MGRAITVRDLQAQIDRLGQFQIDSVNVVERAHYLPTFSRVGPYDKALLDRARDLAPRRVFEYWGHAASLIDVRLYPALRFKMQPTAEGAWGGIGRVQREFPGLVEQVLETVRRDGPLTARQIEHDEVRDRSNWGWNWSAVKTSLEWLLWSGQVLASARNAQFERVYDVPERVLPSGVLDVGPLPEAEARVVLARRAARALGVFSERCVADYFRTRIAPTKVALATLEAAGEIEPVQIASWPGRRWKWHEAKVPRAITGRALICPFDPLIFERNRAHELFDLFYRIEIYVPQAQRQHGYYVYPFLLDGEFVARVDLKADRGAGVLRVQSAWREPGRSASETTVASELAAELADLARWQGLDDVRVQQRGDLAPGLAVAVG